MVRGVKSLSPASASVSTPQIPGPRKAGWWQPFLS